jgi:uncharacterized protein (TIGR02145 family)
MSYIATGPATTLPAYSRTFTIDVADTYYEEEGIVARFSWGEQRNLVIGRSATFNATITTDRVYNVKRLDANTETAGIIVAKFSYPKDDSGSTGTATLKVIPGILDRMFGKADNNGDADTHKFVYLPVTNPITGQTWLNNNLGAEYADTRNLNGNFNPAQQATASDDYKAYGSLFQWGRKADGHELITWTNGAAGVGTNGTRDIKSNDPKHGAFITGLDWRVDRDDTLWENESNNVCPVGYRLPTAGANGTNMEWKPEVNSWNTDNGHDSTTSADALASSLRLPMPGDRPRRKGGHGYGAVRKGGINGNYWYGSAVGSNISAWFLTFDSDVIQPNNFAFRAFGFSVRCKKD